VAIIAVIGVAYYVVMYVVMNVTVPAGTSAGPETSSSRTATTSTHIDNRPVIDQLYDIDDDRRAAVLRGFVVNANESCTEVIRVKLQVRTEDRAVWKALCFRGKEYAVTVARFGQTIVTELK
jgi:hypothetical protein